MCGQRRRQHAHHVAGYCIANAYVFDLFKVCHYLKAQIGYSTSVKLSRRKLVKFDGSHSVRFIAWSNNVYTYVSICCRLFEYFEENFVMYAYSLIIRGLIRYITLDPSVNINLVCRWYLHEFDARDFCWMFFFLSNPVLTELYERWFTENILFKKIQSSVNEKMAYYRFITGSIDHRNIPPVWHKTGVLVRRKFWIM